MVNPRGAFAPAIGGQALKSTALLSPHVIPPPAYAAAPAECNRPPIRPRPLACAPPPMGICRGRTTSSQPSSRFLSHTIDNISFGIVYPLIHLPIPEPTRFTTQGATHVSPFFHLLLVAMPFAPVIIISMPPHSFRILLVEPRRCSPRVPLSPALALGLGLTRDSSRTPPRSWSRTRHLNMRTQ